MGHKNFDDQYFNFTSRKYGEDRINSYYISLLDGHNDIIKDDIKNIIARQFIEEVTRKPLRYTIYDAFINDLKSNLKLKNQFVKYYLTEINAYPEWYDANSDKIDFKELRDEFINRYLNSIPEYEHWLFTKSWYVQDGYHNGILIEPNIGFYDAFYNDLEYILDDLKYDESDKKDFLNRYITELNKKCDKIILDKFNKKESHVFDLCYYDVDKDCIKNDSKKQVNKELRC